MDAALRALNRFGLGARPGQRRQIADDPRGWLQEQLDGPAPLLGAFPGRSRPSGPPRGADLPDLAELGAVFRAYRRRQRAGDARGAEETQRLLRVATSEATEALRARIAGRRPFVERWVAFWSNHLCVSAGRALAVRLLAGHYERTVVRPHALGRFEDMVLASARHPAMLVYLDNARSVGPGSRAVRRRARRGGDRSPGLNENYARELLELHTVGVDGGYTQGDVTELARLLTGWTVAGLAPGGRRLPETSDDVGFAFVPALHEPGEKRVLGSRYGEGEEAGERAIRTLCRHPATARHLAARLVRHFVADAPPPEAVEAVARTFRETGGDLRRTARTVVALDAAWDPAHRKFRTPQDWLVAAVRGVGGTEASPAFLPVLRQLRHPLWSPPAPKGFGDGADAWADPDALMNRAELARTVARRIVGSARRDPDPRILTTVVDTEAGDPLPDLLADATLSVDERVALALAGPAFQWR